MLPSTGYFKEINCPFYDSGLCERPYCHFRHVKKDPQSISGEGIENGDILHQIVSEAVKKVLQQTESAGPTADVSNSTIISQVIQKATYNPTPIAELKKITSTDTENNDDNNEQRRRHIPVPYTPRKPPSLPIKRPEENGECTPYIYVPPPAQYLPGSTDTTTLDQYTPEGAVPSKETYLPGTEAKLQEYKPDETKASNLNYVPSDKTMHKKKLLEYKPVVVSSTKDKPKVVYQPTPKSQTPCFSDDEEPVVKKPKLSSDLCGLDDLGAEFDMLGEILDEEKNEQKCKENIAKTSQKSKVQSDSGIKSHTKQEKGEVKKNKSKNDDLDKHKSDKDKERKDNKKDKTHERKHETSKSDKSVTHKSSSRDKDKRKSTDKNKDKSKEEDKDRHKKSRDKEKSREHKKEHTIKDSTDTKKSKSESERSSSKKSDKHNSKSDYKDKSSNRTSKESSRDKRKEKHKSDKTHNVSEIEEHVADDIMNVEDETLEMSESDEDAIALECKRIFEEYVPTAKSQSTEEDLPTENEIEEYIPTKKRISHTIDKNIKIVPKAPLKPDFKVGAAQQMADRLAKVREYHNKIQLTIEKPETPKTVPNHTKVRIAHVPYASSLLNAKKVRPAAQVLPNAPCTSTAVQTVQKGTKRVAHMPNEKFIDRPGVLEPLGSRIPANIRSTYLNMMIDESLKIYISAVDAYARAQHEELNTNKKCKTIQIYKNSALLTVSRLRKEFQECNGVKKSGLDCTALQKVTGAVTGNSGNAGTWSIENKHKRPYDNPYEYKGPRLYENIKKWILTDEQLQENGFPRPHPNGEKGRATIKSENRTKPPKGIFRTCCRCSKEYTVDKKGFANVKEECVYHPNRKYKFRGEVKYQCCSQDGMSDGCCVAPCHVYDYVDYENLRGYVKTLPPEREMDDYGVYSLDCEMCYTTHGLDLTRITVIDSACKVVYETLIKPLHAIIDYNTRYSGITEEQMVDVRTTLLDVQAALLTMFNSKTILIGHSLESDFKALKLMHDTVIDTSVLFPHKMGPPYKRALRNLSSEHLKKIIQNSVEGHNSAEDATVCMELIHYKLKEDLKTR